MISVRVKAHNVFVQIFYNKFSNIFANHFI